MKNKIKISHESISLGFVFGIMFWLVLDSIALGISLGVVMMIIFNEERKKKTSKR